ncbi:hypothetical protein Pyn_09776 [Prunus yedoensis var. nudiflora]|uniref:Uncharacterized protein n=1 Tax=Prunus yedoensis var. nudiflora TaxID=2094558 RepID=A0A314ZAX9_PRUYE|nr:hypothetical protein Pyn_09776 [Prunus yedoensis var. nudiflora]
MILEGHLQQIPPQEEHQLLHQVADVKLYDHQVWAHQKKIQTNGISSAAVLLALQCIICFNFHSSLSSSSMNVYLARLMGLYTKPKSLCSSPGPVFQGFLHREENCFVYVLQKLIACASAATE